MALVTIVGLTLHMSAWAETTQQPTSDRERAACFSHIDQVDLTSCLADLRNARADLKKGLTPDVSAEAVATNRMKRCDVHPAEDRQDCQARVQGQGTQTGSVTGGGTLTEYVRSIPAQ